jgi:hypothetical protein
MFSDQGQDNEIQSNSTDSSNTQPSNWQGPTGPTVIEGADDVWRRSYFVLLFA